MKKQRGVRCVEAVGKISVPSFSRLSGAAIRAAGDGMEEDRAFQLV